MTNQERTKILEMVASGKLTIEQADQLLERLGAQSLADAEKRPDQRQRAAGFTNFTGEQMAALEVYEVDADYIRALREAGFTDLTVEQLIFLKKHGE
jgi:sugar phosphate isomerase/epimerase